MTIQGYTTSAAIMWGEFIEVAYMMYLADTANTNPSQPGYFPQDWKLIANLNVDLTIGIFSEKQFIGFLTQSTKDPSQVGVGFRGRSASSTGSTILTSGRSILPTSRMAA